MLLGVRAFLFFFFNDTATTEIYTLSLHDALPIWMCLVNHAEVHFVRGRYEEARHNAEAALAIFDQLDARSNKSEARSEEHTSELQSLAYLVCRLLLEKKKNSVTDGPSRRASRPGA